MKNSPKIRKISRKLERFARFPYLVQVGSQKYGKVFKFSFHIFVNNQIWLNQLIDDYHFGPSQNLKRRTLHGTHCTCLGTIQEPIIMWKIVIKIKCHE
jgi:hypothetical protein